MDEKLKKDLWISFVRGFRVTVGLIIGTLIAHFSQQPVWVVVGPIVNMIGKFLREKYAWDWLPV